MVFSIMFVPTKSIINAMLKKTLLISLFIYILMCIIGLCAQVNYTNALREALQTDGTDFEIEKTMLKYGFNIDANDLEEPTTTEKIKALFN